MTPATAPTVSRQPLRPSGLTVLYDAHCPVCRRARRWVERHRQLVPVRFVPAGSDAANTRFPQLDVGSTLADVTVVTDEGAVLRGDLAWITVLWAVARTRVTAIRLAQGRRRRLFGRVKGATELIRKLSTDHPTEHLATGPWPPPTQPGDAGACQGCRT